MDASDAQPHDVLKIPHNASPEEARRAYLALVRQHPPERDADRFRQIHTAYQRFSDPLAQARVLVDIPRERPDLLAEVAAARGHRSPLGKLELLALGNLPERDETPS